MEAQVVAPLGRGWLQCLDGQGIFYFNEATQQSSDVMPAELRGAPQQPISYPQLPGLPQQMAQPEAQAQCLQPQMVQAQLMGQYSQQAQAQLQVQYQQQARYLQQSQVMVQPPVLSPPQPQPQFMQMAQPQPQFMQMAQPQPQFMPKTGSSKWQAQPPVQYAQQARPPSYQPQVQIIQQAAPQQGQSTVKLEVGEWLVCEDAQGEFYFHAPTQQSFDEAPPQLAELLRASQLPQVQTAQPNIAAQQAPQEKKPSEMVLNFRGRPIPVTAALDCTEHVQKALDSPKFKLWYERVQKDTNFTVEDIHFQSIDMFGPKNPGFIKFKMAAKAGGKLCPAIVFMRGGAPAILVVLKRDSDGELFTITVNQPRIAAGSSSFCEIPAGMLDAATGDLTGVAAKEMKEETGLIVNKADLINMTELAHGPELDFQGIYSTCGGSDEYNPILLYRKVVEAEFIDKLQGKKTGVTNEFEDITLRVIPLEKLWQVSADSKALSAICLHEKLLKSGRLSAF